MSKYVHKDAVLLVNTKQREIDLRQLPADEYYRKYADVLRSESAYEARQARQARQDYIAARVDQEAAVYDTPHRSINNPAYLKAQYVKGNIDLEEFEAKLPGAIANESAPAEPELRQVYANRRLAAFMCFGAAVLVCVVVVRLLVGP